MLVFVQPHSVGYSEGYTTPPRAFSSSLLPPSTPMTLSVATARAQLERHVPSGAAASVGTVTICGGGNGAHVAAAYLAYKGVRVNVLTRRPERWGEAIEVTTAGSSWEDRGAFVGRLSLASKHAKHVIPQSDVVIVAAPANAHPDILAAVAPHLKRGVKLGALFAQGGFDWAAKKALGDDRLADVDLVRVLVCSADSCLQIALTSASSVATAALWATEHPVDLQGVRVRVRIFLSIS